MLTLILGGARSGKSGYAVELAKKKGEKVVYLATCYPQDEEMRERIKLHRESRPKHWLTIEEGIDLPGAISNLDRSYHALIVDCITIHISNLMEKGMGLQQITAQVEKLCHEIKKMEFPVILVSNEVGGGIVPENKLAREFRDISGRINQILAQWADEVILMIAGLPLKLK